MPWRMIVTALFLAASNAVAMTGDYVYVDGASLVEITSKQAAKKGTERSDIFFNQLLGAHQIHSGDNLVILVREYHSGGGVVDADRFMKLTVELAKVKYSVPIRFDDPGVRAYYSEGGSSWVPKGSGLYASQLQGTITLIKESNGHLRAEIDASAIAHWVDHRGPDRTVTVLGVYSLVPLAVDCLTPWLGAPIPAHAWSSATSPDR